MNDFLKYSFEKPWFFTNFSFLWTLGIFLIVYSFLFNTSVLRKLYLIAFSLFFYYKSSGPFLLIFILMIIGDYNLAQAIEKVRQSWIRKSLLIISILISLSFLLYFKYSAFFLLTINHLLDSKFNIPNLLLPIGISFYTFQSISYIVDVYQGKIKSSKSFLDYSFYMTFFPHLVAGPIVRAKDFIPQINTPQILGAETMKSAIFRVMLGLSKKLLIADFLSKYVDMIHLNPKLYSGVENLICMYAYACQIYFDFSGYSDIAIGIALLLGYELKENFSNPYKAQNITDFWRRWHMSLSSWLRDYIYIPMGGSRKGKLNTYLFLFITMTIGGFWHGASWNFVIWGILHGFALIVHKLFFSKESNQESVNPVMKWIYTLITFHFVAFLWILFRAQTFQDTFNSVNQIFNNFKFADFVGFYFSRKETVYMLVLAFFIIFFSSKFKEFAKNIFIKTPVLVIGIILFIFLQLVLQIQNTEIAPFIYFKF